MTSNGSWIELSNRKNHHLKNKRKNVLRIKKKFYICQTNKQAQDMKSTKNNTIQSQVMKSAWMIFRSENTTWSEAVGKAWNVIKNGVSVSVATSWKGVKSLVYKKSIADTTYFKATLDQVLECVKNYTPSSNLGAQSFYDDLKYKGD